MNDSRNVSEESEKPTDPGNGEPEVPKPFRERVRARIKAAIDKLKGEDPNNYPLY
jgi:hypothetical protein